MKKLLLLVFLCCTVYAGYSQSQRLVMLEEFTSATCGPCVSANSQFHTWQNTNPDKFTSIYYHVNWPVAGDPMNLANPGEVSTRVSYYMSPSNMYVPYSVLDGNYYNGSAGGWNMNTINTRYAVASPFELQVKNTVNATQDTVFSTVLVKCTQNVGASMTLHNVIIEKWIHFNSAPCASSNGERDFYNVMKKMLPGSGGTTLPTTMAAGDYVLVEGIWKAANVYDYSQIASVGFVQDKSTKEIYQTANSTANPLVLPYNNDLQVLDVVNIPPKTCMNHIAPAVKIRNNGNNTVTSATFKYSINGGDIATYTWTGSLASMEKKVVNLPDYPYAMMTANTLTVYTTQPNNIADQYPKNDTLQYGFALAAVSNSQVKVAVRTDNNPQETTWEIRNSAGTVVFTGGPYTDPNKLVSQTYTLPAQDCYSFTIFDSGSNGLCCTNGNGGYEVSSNGTTIRQGGSFGASERSEFLYSITGVPEAPVAETVTVFPNPAFDRATVEFTLRQPNHATVEVFNAVGKLILTNDLGSLASGEHRTVIQTAGLNQGVYVVRLTTGTQVVSRKLSVVH